MSDIKTPVEDALPNQNPPPPTGGRLGEIISSQQSPLFAQSKDLLIKKLVGMKKEAYNAKRRYTSNYDSNNAFYRGKHWSNERPNYRVSGQMNFVQQLVERKAALLTDAKPIIKVLSNLSDSAPEKMRKQGEDTAQAIEKVIDGIWNEHGLGERLARMIVYAEIFGGCGVNTSIDSERGRFGPDPTFFCIDPRSLAFDPYIYTGDDLYKAQYIIFDDLKSTDYLKYKFKKSAHLIEPSAKFSGGENEEGPGFILNKVRKLFGYETTQVNAIDRTYVTEFWLKDYQAGLDGRLDFPNGRHIILSNENRIIVDEANPYIDGQWPIDFMEWHIDLNTIWGFGDVELYKSPQEVFNKLISLLTENAQLMTNSIWIGDSDSLSPEDWDKLVNEPGSHVKVRPGRNLRRDPPPPLSSGLFNLLTMIMGGMEKLSGISEAMEGRGSSDQSGVAVESLQAAAQTMIRFKARQMETLLYRVGQKLISRIFQYITDDRIFSITGDADQMKAFHFSAKKYIKDPDFSFKDFSFTVVPGSSLPQSKWQKGMQMMQLFQMGVVKNPKRVLDAMEIPDREDIQKENDEIAAKEQEMMMAMQAQSQPSSGGGSGKPNKRGSTGAGGRRSDQLPRPISRSPEVPGASQGGSGPVPGSPMTG